MGSCLLWKEAQLYRFVFYLLIGFLSYLYLVRGHGACSLVNRETLLELWSKLRSEALLVTTIAFSVI